MSYILIDGKKISDIIKQEVKNEIDKICITSDKKPCLAVILCGDNAASSVYVNNKKKACELVGVKSLSYELSADVSEKEVLNLIDKLNNDAAVNGILVQLPLPKHINEQLLLNAIHPIKDVDGFHPVNIGNLLIGNEGFVPCTPAGIIELIERTNIEIAGKHAVIVGRSNIVGKPVSMLLLQKNATVTICHSKTKNLSAITKQADILIAAVGMPKFIKSDMIHKGVVLIDVGINRLEDKKLCGDIDFDDCKEKSLAITPVPGGVGLMTVAILMKNCLKAYKLQTEK